MNLVGTLSYASTLKRMRTHRQSTQNEFNKVQSLAGRHEGWDKYWIPSIITPIITSAFLTSALNEFSAEWELFRRFHATGTTKMQL